MLRRRDVQGNRSPKCATAKIFGVGELKEGVAIHVMYCVIAFTLFRNLTGCSSGSRLQGCSAAASVYPLHACDSTGQYHHLSRPIEEPFQNTSASMAEHEHLHRHHHNNNNMANVGGTYRGGTPKRPGVPFDTNTPSTGIPRPKIESVPTGTGSEMSGHSTISASRQKQSRRDEVGIQPLIKLGLACPSLITTTLC